MIILAFYKSKCKSATWLDKVISFLTSSPYSHVEIIFNGDLFFSSSPRDNGVRYKVIPIEFENWDFFAFDIPIKKECYDFCNKQLYKPYDYKTVFLYHFLGIKYDNKDEKWFCSELIANIIKICNSDLINYQLYKYTPAFLLSELRNSEVYVKQLTTIEEFKKTSKII